MATVEFDSASRIYDPARPPAVNKVSLSIADGEFLVLVGPSGCGKSTTLRMLAGLEPVDEGRIRLGDDDVTNWRARDRDVAMVFQSYALYPNMTARQNMAFALENARVPRAEITQRVAMASRMLELDDLLDKKPAHMSGGQRQRVAMGRAIVRQPRVFCMDEPLSNLDAKLRVSTRAQIAGLQRELGVTTVYVTHDQTEAMTMGDRVAVLKDGVLQQVDTPTHLYEHPVNTFVAGFIGSPAISLLDGVAVVGGEALIGARPAHLALPRAVAARAQRLIVGVRPEAWELVAADAEGAIAFKVALVEHLGSDAYLYGEPVGREDGGVTVRSGRAVIRLDKRLRPEVGDVVHARPREGEVMFFHAETEQNLALPSA